MSDAVQVLPLAMKSASGDMSDPIPRRPARNASTTTVPPPRKGSFSWRKRREVGKEVNGGKPSLQGGIDYPLASNAKLVGADIGTANGGHGEQKQHILDRLPRYASSACPGSSNSIPGRNRAASLWLDMISGRSQHAC